MSSVLASKAAAAAVTKNTGAKQAAVATSTTPSFRPFPSGPNPRGVTTLMYACQQGDVERVRRILRAQPTLHRQKDRSGKSALHYCCCSDNIKAAQAADLLVMVAPDLVESRDQDGFTPLHLAVIAGNLPLVTFLLANSADVNAVDNEKHTVVHWASVCGETGALRAVLAAGAPVSTPDVHGGYPLHYAAQMCGGERDSELGLQVLHALLCHEDIVVSVEDGDGRQPLLWAASAGSAKAMLALIKAGASVEAHDKDGLTALHCAASRGHTDCIDSLLTLCGASPDIIDCNGCTALHYAVTLGHADATALLLAHGADPNRQDRKGRSPAHCGCAKGQFETVKMIGAHGANLWLRNARGDLPLHEAAASGRRDLVRWLLESRPSQVNARNNDGRCPLHLAALNDNADMCKILIDSGAQINPVLRTSKNLFMTPLDCALQRGFRSTAKYLQLHGGVPANRLGTARHHDQKQNQTGANSAMSLHIRDDVTFWGGSTTDSERENADTTATSAQKNKKRSSMRRKFSYKYEKKKDLLNGSEMESAKDKRKNGIPIRVTKSDREEQSSKERLCYSSEMKIDSQMDRLKVERNGEIVMGKSKSVSPRLSARETKEKRPRSAKYSKMKTRSGNKEDTTYKKKESVFKKEESSSRKVDSLSNKQESSSTKETKQNSSRKKEKSNVDLLLGHANVASKSTSTEDSNNNHSDASDKTEIKMVETSTQIEDDKVDSSTQIDEDIIPKSETNNVDVEVPKSTSFTTHADKANLQTQPVDNNPSQALNVDQNQPNPDQQSLMSNTSYEDGDDNKDMVVEASVHSPPKDIENTRSPMIVEAAREEGVDQNQTIKSPQGLEQETSKVGDKIEDRNLTDKTIDEGNQNVDGTVKIKQDAKNEDIKTESVKNEINAEKEEEEAEAMAKDAIEAIIIEDSCENEDRHEENNDKLEDSGLTTDECDAEPESKSFEVLEVVAPKEESEESSGFPKSVGPKQSYEDFAKASERRKRLVMPKDSLQIPHDSSAEAKSSEEDNLSSISSDGSSVSRKTHRSFKILDEEKADESNKVRTKKSSRKPRGPLRKGRSRSEENDTKARDNLKKTRIPAPVNLKSTPRSKSDKYLDRAGRKTDSALESRLPDITKREQRSEPNLSAPLRSVYSDNEQDSASEAEDNKVGVGSASRKRRLKKRAKNRGAKSAGSDYESSNLIDSGFEPSPRSSRIPKWRNMSERGVNMSSVTQGIQSNIRRYHLERKIFQHLLELKRLQIRSGQHNENLLVKRAIDSYHNSCASTVGAGRYVPQDFTFKSFEKFLYQSLRKLQKNGADHLKGLPETSNPLFCTQSTHRCSHATHAYTGVPCAAYLPKMDHHTIPKIGFSCKPSGFLPQIDQKKAVTLELCHGDDKQVISLPADRLDQNKRYYVTFTVKGHDDDAKEDQIQEAGHRHAKSD